MQSGTFIVAIDVKVGDDQKMPTADQMTALVAAVLRNDEQDSFEWRLNELCGPVDQEEGNEVLVVANQVPAEPARPVLVSVH